MASMDGHGLGIDVMPYDYAGTSAAPPAVCTPWEPPVIDAAGNPVVSAARTGGGQEPRADTPADVERHWAEEARRQFEAGRKRGMEEGRAAERDMHRAARELAERRLAEQLASLTATFVSDRDRYLHALEQEVVKLALGIAARILRREAQMDPLLLLGAVRVALGQLSATTRACLRVPAGDLDLWSEAVALLPGSSLKVNLAAGEGMRLGDCVLETELGSVDLGVRAQLNEIERGFFDRAAAPAEESA